MSDHFKRITFEDRTVAIVATILDPRLFDTVLVSELDDELIGYIEDKKPRHLVIDFQRVTQCSTAVINSALRAKKRMVATNGVVKLCGMNKSIRDAYKMLNLDGTVFDIYADADAALAAFE